MLGSEAINKSRIKQGQDRSIVVEDQNSEQFYNKLLNENNSSGHYDRLITEKTPRVNNSPSGKESFASRKLEPFPLSKQVRLLREQRTKSYKENHSKVFNRSRIIDLFNRQMLDEVTRLVTIQGRRTRIEKYRSPYSRERNLTDYKKM